jgi:hypothetical protein
VTVPVPPSERRNQARREARRARRRRAVVVALVLLLAAIVFLFGLSVGRAVEQAPEPGGSQTLVRTLVPATLDPVTVTVTSQPD